MLLCKCTSETSNLNLKLKLKTAPRHPWYCSSSSVWLNTIQCFSLIIKMLNHDFQMLLCKTFNQMHLWNIKCLSRHQGDLLGGALCCILSARRVETGSRSGRFCLPGRYSYWSRLRIGRDVCWNNLSSKHFCRKRSSWQSTRYKGAQFMDMTPTSLLSLVLPSTFSSISIHTSYLPFVLHGQDLLVIFHHTKVRE